MLVLDEKLRPLAQARLTADDEQAQDIDRIRTALQDREVMDILHPPRP